jgi:hypothetical protein
LIFFGEALRLEIQRVTAQQTRVRLMLDWGSFHGSYCSNVELGVPDWAFFSFRIMCKHWRARPKVNLRLNTRTQKMITLDKQMADQTSFLKLIFFKNIIITYWNNTTCIFSNYI